MSRAKETALTFSLYDVISPEAEILKRILVHFITFILVDIF